MQKPQSLFHLFNFYKKTNVMKIITISGVYIPKQPHFLVSTQPKKNFVNL